MQAVVIEELGGPEQLRLVDLPIPEPGPGEVLIRVAYAGVNPADWKTREGWLSQYFEYQFPHVLGYDMSGTVAAHGPDVTGFGEGDRVVAFSRQIEGRGGSYAEYALAEARRVAHVPAEVGLEVAATLPVPAVTAWEAVFEVGAVQAGQHVLVNGGAGGLGSFAVQLSAHAGAKVAATARQVNHQYLRSLGAVEMIDYTRGAVRDAVHAWAPDGVDVIIDAVGQGTLLDAVSMTRSGGVVVPIGTLDVSEQQHAADPDRGIRVVPTMTNHARSGQQLRSLVELLSAGHIQAPAIQILPLAEATRALDLVESGHVRGKLVLAV